MSTTILGDGGAAGAAGTSGGGGAAGAGGTGGSGGSGGSGAAASWRDSLPDDLKADPSLQPFSDVATLAKSYVSTKAMVGKKGVIVPGEKATDEEWTRFYREAGQPELDKFDVKIPDGKKTDPALVSKFKEIAHKTGLLPRQAQGMLEWYTGLEEEAGKTRDATKKVEMKEQWEGLRKEWGQGYDRQMEIGEFGVRELGEDVANWLLKTGLSKDANMVKILNRFGKAVGAEDKIRGDGGGGRISGGQTPAEIQKQIDNIRGNLKHPLFDRTHPGHKAAHAEMAGLYQMLEASKSQAS